LEDGECVRFKRRSEDEWEGGYQVQTGMQQRDFKRNLEIYRGEVYFTIVHIYIEAEQ